MSNTLIIHNSTGRILRTYVGTYASPTDLTDTASGELYVEETSPVLIDPGAYKMNFSGGVYTRAARPLLSTVATWNKTSITANGTDSATLSGLPNPTTIVIDLPAGSTIDSSITLTYTITDGSFTLTANAPGTYTIHAYDPFPYQTYSQTITAT